MSRKYSQEDISEIVQPLLIMVESYCEAAKVKLFVRWNKNKKSLRFFHQSGHGFTVSLDSANTMHPTNGKFYARLKHHVDVVARKVTQT